MTISCAFLDEFVSKIGVVTENNRQMKEWRHAVLYITVGDVTVCAVDRQRRLALTIIFRGEK
jgi:hypothetical protein